MDHDRGQYRGLTEGQKEKPALFTGSNMVERSTLDQATKALAEVKNEIKRLSLHRRAVRALEVDLANAETQLEEEVQDFLRDMLEPHLICTQSEAVDRHMLAAEKLAIASNIGTWLSSIHERLKEDDAAAWRASKAEAEREGEDRVAPMPWPDVHFSSQLGRERYHWPRSDEPVTANTTEPSPPKSGPLPDVLEILRKVDWEEAYWNKHAFLVTSDPDHVYRIEGAKTLTDMADGSVWQVDSDAGKLYQVMLQNEPSPARDLPAKLRRVWEDAEPVTPEEAAAIANAAAENMQASELEAKHAAERETFERFLDECKRMGPAMHQAAIDGTVRPKTPPVVDDEPAPEKAWTICDADVHLLVQAAKEAFYLGNVEVRINMARVGATLWFDPRTNTEGAVQYSVNEKNRPESPEAKAHLFEMLDAAGFKRRHYSERPGDPIS